jgi:hypothetical protein
VSGSSVASGGATAAAAKFVSTAEIMRKFQVCSRQRVFLIGCPGWGANPGPLGFIYFLILLLSHSGSPIAATSLVCLVGEAALSFYKQLHAPAQGSFLKRFFSSMGKNSPRIKSFRQAFPFFLRPRSPLVFG